MRVCTPSGRLGWWPKWPQSSCDFRMIDRHHPTNFWARDDLAAADGATALASVQPCMFPKSLTDSWSPSAEHRISIAVDGVWRFLTLLPPDNCQAGKKTANRIISQWFYMDLHGSIHNLYGFTWFLIAFALILIGLYTFILIYVYFYAFLYIYMRCWCVYGLGVACKHAAGVFFPATNEFPDLLTMSILEIVRIVRISAFVDLGISGPV